MARKFVYVVTILCFRCKFYASLQVLEGRVIGGEYMKINNYPHAAFLEISRRNTPAHVCGSSIVNQHFLLTAAHCFTFQNRGKEDKIVAFAGHEDVKQFMKRSDGVMTPTLLRCGLIGYTYPQNSLDIFKFPHDVFVHPKMCKTNVVRKALPPIIHENFDIGLVVNDIALIYLPQNLPLGESIKRVSIKESFPRTRIGALAGWGIINEITFEETMLLKSVPQTVKNQSICSSVINGPGTLCAGSTRSSDPRPAQGDSGSGLISNGYQLIGLLSYKETSHPALPVYTNVSYYYNWIKHNITNAYCKFESIRAV